VILIDVFENFRQIIVITNTADYSGFVVDACMRVRTESSGIAVYDGSVCPNDRLTVFRISHFLYGYMFRFNNRKS
tara:strand:+ start:57 stop:281 length:225 start_codon:yes stop_codon:yes gene_type:complete